MGLTLRQGNSGAILDGENDGDALVWNASSGEWEPGSAGTALPDGSYPGQPLTWDGAAWLGGLFAVVQGVIANDPTGGLSVDAQAGALTLTGGGQGISLSTVALNISALAGTTLALLVDGVQRFEANDTGLAFFGVAPVARPSITGATEQEQIDSIVAALVALGLVTDDR